MSDEVVKGLEVSVSQSDETTFSSNDKATNWLCVSDYASHHTTGEEEVADRNREQETSAGGWQESSAALEGEMESYRLTVTDWQLQKDSYRQTVTDSYRQTTTNSYRMRRTESYRQEQTTTDGHRQKATDRQLKTVTESYRQTVTDRYRQTSTDKQLHSATASSYWLTYTDSYSLLQTVPLLHYSTILQYSYLKNLYSSAFQREILLFLLPCMKPGRCSY